MMRAIALAALALCSACSRPKSTASDYFDAVMRGDPQAVARLKGRWEWGWDSTWKLKGISPSEVEHGERGWLIEWVREEGAGRRILRRETYGGDGRFRQGGERTEEAGRELSSARVFIRTDGRIAYKMRAVYRIGAGKLVGPAGVLLPSISHYELEVFDRGQLVAVYASKSNFGVDGESLVLTSVPADSTVIWGTGNPVVEKARAVGSPERG